MADTRLRSQDVWEILDSDTILLEAMARGIVNQRGLARWLIKTHGLDASEEAILSALRRKPRGAASQAFESGRRLLAGSHVNARTSICEIVLRKTPEVPNLIASTFDEVDFMRGDLLHWATGDRGVRLLCDEENLDAVLKVFGKKALSVKRDLAAVVIVFPADAAETPGGVGLIGTALGLAGISIVNLIAGYPESAYVVFGHDFERAFLTIRNLISTSKAWTTHRASRAPTVSVRER